MPYESLPPRASKAIHIAACRCKERNTTDGVGNSEGVECRQFGIRKLKDCNVGQ